MIFAFDVDGVIFNIEGDYHPSLIGSLKDESVEALKWVRDRGHTIVIFSCRVNPEVSRLNHWGNYFAELVHILREHLIRHNVPFDKIAVFKPNADWYFDDRANFTNWVDVKRKIIELEESYGYNPNIIQ